MDKQEILEKAIQKAIDGGWSIYGYPDYTPNKAYKWLELDKDYMVKDLIFNHDFAKALWGVNSLYHLQQMVVKDDPIKYLGENI